MLPLLRFHRHLFSRLSRPPVPSSQGDSPCFLSLCSSACKLELLLPRSASVASLALLVVLPLNMVDKSINPLRTHFKPIFMMGQSREAFTSLSEPVSECFCEHLRQTPHDFTLHSSLAWRLSSGNRQQGTQEHLAGRPSSGGSPGGHDGRPLPIAFGHQLAPSLLWLHEHHAQCLVRPHKVIIGAPGVGCADPTEGWEESWCKGRWRATARARVASSVNSCAVHPVAGAGAGDGRRSVHARPVHVCQRESARW